MYPDSDDFSFFQSHSLCPRTDRQVLATLRARSRERTCEFKRDCHGGGGSSRVVAECRTWNADVSALPRPSLQSSLAGISETSFTVALVRLQLYCIA